MPTLTYPDGLILHLSDATDENGNYLVCKKLWVNQACEEGAVLRGRVSLRFLLQKDLEEKEFRQRLREQSPGGSDEAL